MKYNDMSVLSHPGKANVVVDDFVSIASPLTSLTEKSVDFEWLEACERSFQILKESLTSALVLTLTKGIKGFIVYYDASRVGLGCVFMKHKKVIFYASIQLKVH